MDCVRGEWMGRCINVFRERFSDFFFRFCYYIFKIKRLFVFVAKIDIKRSSYENEAISHFLTSIIAAHTISKSRTFFTLAHILHLQLALQVHILGIDKLNI